MSAVNPPLCREKQVIVSVGDILLARACSHVEVVCEVNVVPDTVVDDVVW